MLWHSVLVTPAATREDPGSLCVEAATEAAEKTNVPVKVLLAIAIVETGRSDQPWPWTVNVGGEGQWFETAEEASAHVSDVLGQGLTNVDLGCFQLNYRWHANAFTSVEDMLDPVRNASYAADFLAQHYAKTGDWSAAAAAYHSGTTEFAEIYRQKFDLAYAALSDGSIAEAPPEDERQNSFPLLVAGETGANGSLVPATSGGLRLIGTP